MAKNVKKLINPYAHKATRPIIREPLSEEDVLAGADLAVQSRFKPELPQMAPGSGVSVPELTGTQLEKGRGNPFNPVGAPKLPNGKGWN